MKRQERRGERQACVLCPRVPVSVCCPFHTPVSRCCCRCRSKCAAAAAAAAGEEQRAKRSKRATAAIPSNRARSAAGKREGERRVGERPASSSTLNLFHSPLVGSAVPASFALVHPISKSLLSFSLALFCLLCHIESRQRLRFWQPVPHTPSSSQAPASPSPLSFSSQNVPSPCRSSCLRCAVRSRQRRR